MQTMENNQSTPVFGTQRTTAPLKRRLNVRQPLSCTVCRRRKSKCNRRLPCSACEKRQSPHLCAYNHGSQSQASQVSSSRRDDLSSQLEGLEALVQRHFATGAPRPRRDHGPCLQADQPSANQSLAMSEPYIQPDSAEASHFPSLEGNSPAVPFSNDTPQPGLCGALYSSDDGSVEYKVDRLHWSAVLSDQDAKHVFRLAESKLPVNESTNGFPFYAAMPAPVDTLHAMIPPKQQRDYLVSRYFSSIAPLYHVLHEPKFCEEYSKFCRDPQSVPLSWLALLYVVLSLGISTLEDGMELLDHLGVENDRSTSVTSLAAHFQDAAMSCLAADQFMIRHRLSTFQALTMLIYAKNNSEGTGSTWSLLGLTVHIGTALGCHIDGSKLKLDCIEAEERRRSWAALLMLHTIQGVAFGKPEITPMYRKHITLPADTNDMNIFRDRIEPAPNHPTQMTYLIYKFQLYQTTSSLIQCLLDSPQKPSEELVLSLETRIEAERKKWDDRYAHDNDTSLLQGHHRVQYHLLLAYSHQLTLLLFRPFLNENSTGDFSRCVQSRCMSSAIALLEIHNLFFEDPAFKDFSWYGMGLGSFHAFHGAVVLAAILLKMDDSDTAYHMNRSILDGSIQRFSSLAERSRICARAIPVLQYLRSLLQLDQQSMQNSIFDLGLQGSNDMHLAEPRPVDINDILANRLEPNKWFNASNIDWDEWEQLIRQPGFS